MNLLEDIKKIEYHVTSIYMFKINKHTYIGSSENTRHRLYCHRSELVKNKHDNKFLQNCFNKYKVCDFFIIETFDDVTIHELRSKELEYIKIYNADLNIDCPVKGIGGKTCKKVYQYDLDGNFIKEWESASSAARFLKGNSQCITSCCNMKNNAKTYYNFKWSKKKVKNLKITKNNGINLPKSKIKVYFIDSKNYKIFKSLSDFAKFLKIELNYDKDWKNLRSGIYNSLKNNTVYLNKYKIKPQK